MSGNTSPQAAALATPPTPTSTPEKEELIEVNLLHRYCPFFYIEDDGTLVEQDSRVATKAFEPGLRELHPKDAKHALTKQIASPTQKTYERMR